MLTKMILMALSGVLSVSLAGALAPQGPGEDRPPPPKKKGDPKKKGGPGGPAHDLRKAYELLGRLRAEGAGTGRPEPRVRDWTDRAVVLYRKGIDAERASDPALAHEYGAAAHDLARAIDHVRRSTWAGRSDSELPPPPSDDGPEGLRSRSRRDLRRAFDRIRDGRDRDANAPDASFYLDAARDLYNAARRDIAEDRLERGGELARAAEAITHVPEHLGHASARRAGPSSELDRRPEPPRDRPGPRGDDLPPPLD